MKKAVKTIAIILMLLSLVLSALTACGTEDLGAGGGNGGDGGSDGSGVTEPPRSAIQSIAIRYDGGREWYAVGESVDATRLIVTAVYDSGEVRNFTAASKEGCVIEPESFEAGDDKVTVTYGGASASFGVIVYDLKITEVIAYFGDVPSNWFSGSPVDLRGISVKVKYGDSLLVDADEYTVIDKDTGTEYAPGEITLPVGIHDNMVVCYKEVCSAPFTIAVYDKSDIKSLKVGFTGVQTVCLVGNALDLGEITVRAEYGNGFSVGVSEYTVVDKDTGTEYVPGEITLPVGIYDNMVVSYSGVESAPFTLTVYDEADADEIIAEFGNVPNRYAEGSVIDISGISVNAVYGDTLKVAVYDYTVVDKDTGTEYAPYNISLSKGTHDNMVVRYYGVESAPFTLTVFSGYVVEAENIINSADVTDEDRNYVELITATGSSGSTTTGISPGPVRKETEPASGGAYLGDLKTGGVFAFHIWSDVERDAEIILTASSGNIQDETSYNSWIPVLMGDMQFNRLFRVTYSNSEAESQTINIDDNVILEGGRTDDPNGDPLLWVNWKEVVFGSVRLKPGDNVFTFTVISDYINMHNASCAANIDKMEVRFIG